MRIERTYPHIGGVHRNSVFSLCAVAAAAVLLGLAVVADMRVTLLVFLISGLCASLLVICIRANAVPKRFVDILIVSGILVIPIVPYLTTLSPYGSLFRFAVSGAALLALVFRLVPGNFSARNDARWLVVVFAIYQILPTLSNGLNLYSALRGINWVMFISLAFIRYDIRSLRFAVGATVAVTILVVVGVALQFYGQLGGIWGGQFIYGSTFSEANDRLTRYTSFLQNPNDLGLFMFGVGTGLMLFGQLRLLNFPARIACMCGSGICIAIVLLSSSRGALLATFVVIPYFMAAKKLGGLLRLTVVGLMSITILSVVWPPIRVATQTTAASIQAIVVGDDVSASDRTQTWSKWLQSATNPVIGSGYGGYSAIEQVDRASITSFSTRNDLYTSLTVDNGWLKLWLEQGFIGVALLASILAYWIRKSLRRLRGYSNPLPYVLVGALLVILTFRAFSADIFDTNPWNFFIWLLVGVQASLQEQSAGAMEYTLKTGEQGNE